MREHRSYDEFFPGNRIGDGRFRLAESDYLTQLDRYADTLLSFNINPEIFRGRFGDLIAGEVSPDEFTARVSGAFSLIEDRLPQVSQFYAANFGVDLTQEAILASFLDPDIGEQILTRRLAISDIGGAAALQNFNIDVDFSRRLFQAGVGGPGGPAAEEIFAQAAEQIPVFDVLAARHNDPDDDFDLFEFTQAAVFNDPTQRRRLRRLLAAEQSEFSRRGGPFREGVFVTGLEQR